MFVDVALLDKINVVCMCGISFWVAFFHCDLGNCMVVLALYLLILPLFAVYYFFFQMV